MNPDNNFPYNFLIPAVFRLDTIQYPGFHNPRRTWNGWAVPYFTLDTCLKILEDEQLQNAFIEDGQYFVVGEDEEKYEPVDGLYCLGGFVWTWELVKD